MPEQIEHLEADPQGGLDLQPQTFTARMGVKVRQGFAQPLPDGRFGRRGDRLKRCEWKDE